MLNVWCRISVVAEEVSFGVRLIHFQDGNAVTKGYFWEPVTNNVNTWKMYTLHFTSTSDSEALAIYFRISGSAQSGDVFWDDLSLIEVPVK